MNNKWISVKDRMPDGKKPQIVLVCHLNNYKGAKAMISKVDTAIFNKGEFKLGIIIETLMGKIWLNLRDVTHWMPLPKPPNPDV